MKIQKVIITTTIIIFVSVLRGLEIIPNFSPLIALCLFGASHFEDKKLSVIIPLLGLFFSDWVLSINNSDYELFYSGFYWQYFAYLIILSFGYIFYNKLKIGFTSTILSVFIGGLLFFLVSNFGVWFSSTMYTKDVNGLLNCFIMGIPFYRFQVLGDLFFTTILFGGFYFIQKYNPSIKPTNVIYRL